MVKRTFYNVGDALFAVEQIDGCKYVYDCGGQNMDLVKSAIKKAFKKGDEIEAVFISHYDADHINGVCFLLNHCKVKRLILPMMTDAIKLILLILQKYKGGLDEFIIDPEEYVHKISQDTDVTFVNDNRDLSSDAAGGRDVSFDDLLQLSMINSGTRITHGTSLAWVYIPMCIVTLTYKQETDFIAKLLELLGISVPAKKVDVKQLWKEHSFYGGKKDKDPKKIYVLNKVKEAIQTIVPGLDDNGINAASQTLYSGPCCHSKTIRMGCLYMGDFDAKNNWKELIPVYGVFLKNILVVQVPHHGSKNNFADEMIETNSLAVISAGLNTKIKIGDTITRIMKKNGIALMTGSRGDIEIKCDVVIGFVSSAKVFVY